MERKLQETLLFRGRLFDSEGGGGYILVGTEIFIFSMSSAGRSEYLFSPATKFWKKSVYRTCFRREAGQEFPFGVLVHLSSSVWAAVLT